MAPTDRPSRALFALEPFRAAGELGVRMLSEPVLRRAPRGDGHPVLVLPGFTGSDASTRVMRAFLRRLGYHVHAWRLGRNWGPTDAVVEGLLARFDDLATKHGRKLTLVGHSLGGIYAREMARVLSHRVRQVVTLGSPIRVEPGLRSNVAPLYRAVSGRHSDRVRDVPLPEVMELPPVPLTAIFTRSDGVVGWGACLCEGGPMRECIEVRGSHSGLVHNPVVLRVVADRLAQPEGSWVPFAERRGLAARPWAPDTGR